MRLVVPGTEELLAASAAAPIPGATRPRRSAQPRPWVRPRLYERLAPILVTDPYVRRYWTAAIGPQAVADLMRLVRAAEQGQRIRRPIRLAVIIENGLGFWAGGELFVSRHIPQPPRHLLPRRLR